MLSVVNSVTEYVAYAVYFYVSIQHKCLAYEVHSVTEHVAYASYFLWYLSALM